MVGDLGLVALQISFAACSARPGIESLVIPISDKFCGMPSFVFNSLIKSAGSASLSIPIASLSLAYLSPTCSLLKSRTIGKIAALSVP